MKYKPSNEYKILFLYFKKQCTFKEISELLNTPILTVSKVVAVEITEIKKQHEQSCFYYESGKVKLN
jgi:DNA-directed RNA polymerase specialized sigma subunit